MRNALDLSLLAMLVLGAPRLAEAAPVTPPSGFRADYIVLLDRLEKELVPLERAMPQSKFEWRPAPGVRSVAEVYLHAASNVYFLMGKLGHTPPPAIQALMDGKKWENQSVQREQIGDILVAAIAFLRDAMRAEKEPDLDRTIALFGTTWTARAVFMRALDHFHEHLGQSIAYARVNGIAPPWSKKE